MAAKARPHSVQPSTTQVVFLIAAIAVVAYWPALSGGFLFDDDTLVTQSPMVQAANGLYRMWCTTEPLDYWPLTNTSFWLEWRLWGTYSTGYHLTNLALHIGSGVLLWSILRRLNVPGALLAALLFVVHPVNVESVAWIAQRKNTLSMAFFLLSILWYLRFDDHEGRLARDGFRKSLAAAAETGDSPKRSRKRTGRPAAHRLEEKLTHGHEGQPVRAWYWLSLLAFVLAMLSKGSVAILPALLLLIVWWRSGTVTMADVLRTTPFFAVSAALTLVNVWFQNHYMAGASIRDVTLAQRVVGAAGIVWFYLYKALLPIKLIFIYPQWIIRADDVRWWVPLVAGLALTAVLFWQRSHPIARALLFAWGFFVLALVPVMGLTDVYFMKIALVADHYQYIAIIGVVAAVAAALSRRRDVPGRRRSTTQVASVLLVTVLGVLTWRQTTLYGDVETLYRRTLAQNPSSWLIHNNLGTLLLPRSMDEAMAHFREAVRLGPGQIEAHNNLCHAAANARLIDETVTECTATLHIDPNLAIAHNDLGGALAALGRLDAARPEFEAALRLDPNSADAHNNLANILAGSHRDAEAIDHYREAIRIQPDFATAHSNLALLLEKQGRVKDAIQEYQEALRLDSSLSQARNRLDVLLK